MKFHEVHGLNVEVNEWRRVARRTGSFCDAFVFSEAPVRLNSMTAIKFGSPETEWAGHAFLGVTSRNPVSFVDGANLKHIIPLLSAEDVWIRPIQSVWASATLVVHLTYDGQLEIITDSEPNIRYCLFENLPVNFPLWLVVDIYGSTNCVQLPTYGQPNSPEIVALGSDVSATYKCGKEGIVPFNYARVVVVGPKGAGKTTLINLLAASQAEQQQQQQAQETVPASSDGEENSTENAPEGEDESEMIEPTRSYLSQANASWTLMTSTGPNRIVLNVRAKSDIFYDLAKNIVHEIVLHEREQQLDMTAGTSTSSSSPAGGAATSRDLIRSVFKFPGTRKPRKSYTKEVKQLSENSSEIPEELIFLVEEMLKNLPDDCGKTKGAPPLPTEPSVGEVDPAAAVIPMTPCGSGLAPNEPHRIFCAVYLFVFNLADDLDATVERGENLGFISELNRQPLTLLNSMHLWLSLIHATIAVFPTPNEQGEAEPETLNVNANGMIDSTEIEGGGEEGEEVEDATLRLPEIVPPGVYSANVQPQVILVGTHRNSIHGEPITRNQMTKEIFERIFASFEDKPYASHLHRGYIAVDSKEMSFDEPDLVDGLRKLIDELIVHEKATGFNVPLPWLQLGQILEKLRQRGIYFVDINQLHEVVSTQVDCFQSYENLNAALYFYHNQARIFYLDCVGQNSEGSAAAGERYVSESHGMDEAHGHTHRLSGSYEMGIIILDPSWFIQCVYRLCGYIQLRSSQANAGRQSLEDDDEDDHLAAGIISETVINQAWGECLDQKFILLGCLENLDIICELSPYIQLEDAPDVATTTMMPKLYFFPWITKPTFTSSTSDDSSLGKADIEEEVATHVGAPTVSDSFGESTFRFVIVFNMLPVALFTRLLIRLSKWSWSQGWGRKPEVANMRARIAVDFDHDIIMKVSLLQGHIFVIIVKIFDELQNDQIENLLIGPTANVCVKVQHLVESELESLKITYYRRLNFGLVVPCPCDATCDRHRVDGCLEEDCLHFLPLQDCLKRKVVECKYHRQVRTAFIQRYLPYAASSNGGNSGNGSGDMLYDSIYNVQGQTDVWDNIFQEEPMWMREAAKLLNSNHLNNDWIALAKRLSYSERDVSKFADEISPSLAILKDWYESNGRTRYCIDVLISCLRMLGREDIASLIEYELEPESISPPIFLSYQRDSQKQVLDIRRKLELSGFPCWMDTSSMGGGESLYGKIYEGISRAKVFICCLTPRYVASPMCNREVTLADVLHKPILPLVIEFTPWPPPGAMALIMSSIVYIDMCGVGSHSGIGRVQDTESLFRDILDRVTRYISGYSDGPVVSSRYLQLPDLFIPRRNEQLLVNGRHLAAPGGGGGRDRPRGSVRVGAREMARFHGRRLSRQASEARSVSSPPPSSENGGGGENGRMVANEVMLLMEQRVAGAVQGEAGSLGLGEANDSRYSRLLTQRRSHEFGDDLISGDNISVISRSRIANRITSCALCNLM